MEFAYRLAFAAALVAAGATVPAAADETPKRGGTLTYMIAADAPPSFDGHREQTFAMIHPVAPFGRTGRSTLNQSGRWSWTRNTSVLPSDWGLGIERVGSVCTGES